VAQLIDRIRFAPHRPLVATAALALALGFLAACGGSNSDSGAASGTSGSSQASGSEAGSASPTASSGAAQAQSLNATETNGKIALDKQALTAGDYTIQVVNNGTASHDLVVEQNGQAIARSEMLAPGASGTVSVALAPGEYVFYCSVGNHRAMGMELTVQVS
jgi:plastocyanin